jgi:hypothetical protein
VEYPIVGLSIISLNISGFGQMFKFPIKTVGAVSMLFAGSAYNWHSTASEEERKNYAVQMKTLDFLFSSISNSFMGLGEMSNKLVLDKIQGGAKKELEVAKAQMAAMEDAQKKTAIEISQLHNKIDRTDIESMKRDLSLATQGDQTPYGGLTHAGYVGTILGTTGIVCSAISTAGATSATTIGTGAFLLSGGVLGVGGAFLAIAGIMRASQPSKAEKGDVSPSYSQQVVKA